MIALLAFAVYVVTLGAMLGADILTGGAIADAFGKDDLAEYCASRRAARDKRP